MKTKRSIHVLVMLMSIALLALMAVQYVWLGSAVKIKSEEFDRNVLAAMRATAVAIEDKNTLRFMADRIKSDTGMLQEENGFYQFIEEAVTGETEVTEIKTEEENQTIVTVNNSPQHKKMVMRTRIKNGEEKEIETIAPYPALPPIPPVSPIPVPGKKEKFMTVMCQAADEYAAASMNWKQTLDSGLLNKTMHRQFEKFHLPADYSFAVVSSENDSVLFCNTAAAKPSTYKFKTELMGFDFTGKGLWLLVEFPSRLKFVFASLAGMFALSLIFSGVIVAVFVLALQLIFRQKKLNEITNDFITNMTHEFKTPLATISMTADTLRLNNISEQREQVKEYAAMIKEETRKLATHVDRILESASQEKQRTTTSSAANLTRVIQQQFRQHENIFNQNGVKLHLHLPDETIQVIAGEEQLGYVISNLLDNAIKYSTGQPEINISAEKKAATALLKITDKGIGISKENRQLVFEKFFRAHTGNRHDVKGFGLGLSFVKNAVEGWGGKVWVESELGKGSTFFVELKRTGV